MITIEENNNHAFGTAELSEKEYLLFRDLVQKQCGIQLPPHKKALVRNRLWKIMKKEGFTTFNEYYEHIKTDPC